MKKKQKKIIAIFFYAALTNCLLFFNACKKPESDTHLFDSKDVSEVEKRFFSNHRPINESVERIFEKILHDNNSLHFAEKIVEKVGYPFWDKAIIQQATVSKSGNRNANNPDLVIAIPFVRNNEHYVNAELVVKIIGDDTLFKWRNDWQYKNYSHGSLNDTASAEFYAVSQMMINYSVFGDSIFKITDSTLFNFNPTRKITGLKLTSKKNDSGKNNISNIQNGPLPDNCVYTTGLDENGIVVVTGILCMAEEGSSGGGVLVITSGGGQWWYYEETGGGGTGGTYPGGGTGYIPPDCGPPVVLRGNTIPDCGPGYVLYPDLTLTAQLNIAQQFFTFQSPGDILYFDNTIDPNQSQSFSTVNAFQDYLATNFPQNPTSNNSTPPTIISTTEKIVHAKFNLSFIAGVDVSCKLVKNGNIWQLTNVTSTEYGVSFSWSWEQQDYSQSVVGNEIILICEGYVKYNIFLEGIGTIFKVRRRFEIKINNVTGTITSSKQI